MKVNAFVTRSTELKKRTNETKQNNTDYRFETKKQIVHKETLFFRVLKLCSLVL